MPRKKNISVYSDLKTGFFSKLFLSIGFSLVILFIVIKTFFLDLIGEDVLNIMIAFSIIFLGLGFIIYFFYFQFKRLADIAREIEEGDEQIK
ncbi:MAG: hypothetical protein DRN05_01355 [Thermoplasmata archaeon]|nr:MAG: hypothetical protein DRN05_01355 [Thermoplasmata archaeon]